MNDRPNKEQMVGLLMMALVFLLPTMTVTVAPMDAFMLASCILLITFPLRDLLSQAYVVPQCNFGYFLRYHASQRSTRTVSAVKRGSSLSRPKAFILCLVLTLFLLTPSVSADDWTDYCGASSLYPNDPWTIDTVAGGTADTQNGFCVNNATVCGARVRVQRAIDISVTDMLYAEWTWKAVNFDTQTTFINEGVMPATDALAYPFFVNYHTDSIYVYYDTTGSDSLGSALVANNFSEGDLIKCAFAFDADANNLDWIECNGNRTTDLDVMGDHEPTMLRVYTASAQCNYTASYGYISASSTGLPAHVNLSQFDCKNIPIYDTTGEDRDREIIKVNVTGLIYDNVTWMVLRDEPCGTNGARVDFEPREYDGSTWADILFRANIPANGVATYALYHNNQTAMTPESSNVFGVYDDFKGATKDDQWIEQGVTASTFTGDSINFTDLDGSGGQWKGYSNITDMTAPFTIIGRVIRWDIEYALGMASGIYKHDGFMWWENQFYTIINCDGSGSCSTTAEFTDTPNEGVWNTIRMYVMNDSHFNITVYDENGDLDQSVIKATDGGLNAADQFYFGTQSNTNIMNEWDLFGVFSGQVNAYSSPAVVYPYDWTGSERLRIKGWVNTTDQVYRVELPRYAGMQADVGDVRISPGVCADNNVTILEYEIKNYTNSTIELRVLFPELNEGWNEYCVRWGNSYVKSAEDGPAVWHNYKAVYLYKYGDFLLDSTGNGHDHVNYNSAAQCDGLFGGAACFDGTNQLLGSDNSADFNPRYSNFTIESVFNYTNNNTYGRLASRQFVTPACGYHQHYILGIRSSLHTNPRNAMLFTINDCDEEDVALIKGTTDVYDGEYHYAAGVRIDTGGHLYVDGALEGSNTTHDLQDVNVDGQNFSVGNYGLAPQTSNGFNGTIQETRFALDDLPAEYFEQAEQMFFNQSETVILGEIVITPVIGATTLHWSDDFYYYAESFFPGGKWIPYANGTGTPSRNTGRAKLDDNDDGGGQVSIARLIPADQMRINWSFMITAGTTEFFSQVWLTDLANSSRDIATYVYIDKAAGNIQVYDGPSTQTELVSGVVEDVWYNCSMVADDNTSKYSVCCDGNCLYDLGYKANISTEYLTLTTANTGAGEAFFDNITVESVVVPEPYIKRAWGLNNPCPAGADCGYYFELANATAVQRVYSRSVEWTYGDFGYFWASQMINESVWLDGFNSTGYDGVYWTNGSFIKYGETPDAPTMDPRQVSLEDDPFYIAFAPFDSVENYGDCRQFNFYETNGVAQDDITVIFNATGLTFTSTDEIRVSYTGCNITGEEHLFDILSSGIDWAQIRTNISIVAYDTFGLGIYMDRFDWMPPYYGYGVAEDNSSLVGSYSEDEKNFLSAELTGTDLSFSSDYSYLRIPRNSTVFEGEINVTAAEKMETVLLGSTEAGAYEVPGTAVCSDGVALFKAVWAFNKVEAYNTSNDAYDVLWSHAYAGWGAGYEWTPGTYVQGTTIYDCQSGANVGTAPMSEPRRVGNYIISGANVYNGTTNASICTLADTPNILGTEHAALSSQWSTFRAYRLSDCASLYNITDGEHPTGSGFFADDEDYLFIPMNTGSAVRVYNATTGATIRTDSISLGVYGNYYGGATNGTHVYYQGSSQTQLRHIGNGTIVWTDSAGACSKCTQMYWDDDGYVFNIDNSGDFINIIDADTGDVLSTLDPGTWTGIDYLRMRNNTVTIIRNSPDHFKAYGTGGADTTGDSISRVYTSNKYGDFTGPIASSGPVNLTLDIGFDTSIEWNESGEVLGARRIVDFPGETNSTMVAELNSLISACSCSGCAIEGSGNAYCNVTFNWTAEGGSMTVDASYFGYNLTGAAASGITLLNPPNGTTNTTDSNITVQFQVGVDDTCTINLDGIAQVSAGSEGGSPLEYVFDHATEGLHNWSVNCTAQGWSDTEWFTVDEFDISAYIQTTQDIYLSSDEVSLQGEPEWWNATFTERTFLQTCNDQDNRTHTDEVVGHQMNMNVTDITIYSDPAAELRLIGMDGNEIKSFDAFQYGLGEGDAWALVSYIVYGDIADGDCYAATLYYNNDTVVATTDWGGDFIDQFDDFEDDNLTNDDGLRIVWNETNGNVYNFGGFNSANGVAVMETGISGFGQCVNVNRDNIGASYLMIADMHNYSSGQNGPGIYVHSGYKRTLLPTGIGTASYLDIAGGSGGASDRITDGWNTISMRRIKSATGFSGGYVQGDFIANRSNYVNFGSASAVCLFRASGETRENIWIDNYVIYYVKDTTTVEEKAYSYGDESSFTQTDVYPFLSRVTSAQTDNDEFFALLTVVNDSYALNATAYENWTDCLTINETIIKLNELWVNQTLDAGQYKAMAQIYSCYTNESLEIGSTNVSYDFGVTDLTLDAPASGMMNTTSNKPDLYFTTGLDDTCSVYVNGDLNATGGTTAGIQSVLDMEVLEDGFYTWYVACDDAGTSDTWNFTIDEYDLTASIITDSDLYSQGTDIGLSGSTVYTINASGGDAEFTSGTLLNARVLNEKLMLDAAGVQYQQITEAINDAAGKSALPGDWDYAGANLRISNGGLRGFWKYQMNLTPGTITNEVILSMMPITTYGQDQDALDIWHEDTDNCTELNVTHYSYPVVAECDQCFFTGNMTASTWFNSSDVSSVVNSYLSRPGYEVDNYMCFRSNLGAGGGSRYVKAAPTDGQQMWVDYGSVETGNYTTPLIDIGTSCTYVAVEYENAQTIDLWVKDGDGALTELFTDIDSGTAYDVAGTGDNCTVLLEITTDNLSTPHISSIDVSGAGSRIDTTQADSDGFILYMYINNETNDTVAETYVAWSTSHDISLAISPFDIIPFWVNETAIVEWNGQNMSALLELRDESNRTLITEQYYFMVVGDFHLHYPLNHTINTTDNNITVIAESPVAQTCDLIFTGVDFNYSKNVGLSPGNNSLWMHVLDDTYNITFANCTNLNPTSIIENITINEYDMVFYINALNDTYSGGSELGITDPPEGWSQQHGDWSNRVNISLADALDFDFNDSLVRLNVTDLVLNSNCTNELRAVWDGNGTNVTIQTINEGADWCEELFYVDRNQTNKTITFYYDNPAASMPVYPTDLTWDLPAAQYLRMVGANYDNLTFYLEGGAPATVGGYAYYWNGNAIGSSNYLGMGPQARNISDEWAGEMPFSGSINDVGTIDVTCSYVTGPIAAYMNCTDANFSFTSEYIITDYIQYQTINGGHSPDSAYRFYYQHVGSAHGYTQCGGVNVSGGTDCGQCMDVNWIVWDASSADTVIAFTDAPNRSVAYYNNDDWNNFWGVKSDCSGATYLMNDSLGSFQFNWYLKDTGNNWERGMQLEEATISSPLILTQGAEESQIPIATQSRIDNVQSDNDLIAFRMFITTADNVSDEKYVGYETWDYINLSLGTSPIKMDQYWINYTVDLESGNYTLWLIAYNDLNISYGSGMNDSFNFSVSNEVHILYPSGEVTDTQNITVVYSSTANQNCTIWRNDVPFYNQTASIGNNTYEFGVMAEDTTHNWTVTCEFVNATEGTVEYTINEYELTGSIQTLEYYYDYNDTIGITDPPEGEGSGDGLIHDDNSVSWRMTNTELPPYGAVNASCFRDNDGMKYCFDIEKGYFEIFDYQDDFKRYMAFAITADQGEMSTDEYTWDLLGHPADKFEMYNLSAQFNWSMFFDFDSVEPLKITHNITQITGITLTSSKMWYIFTINPDEEALYNGVNYSLDNDYNLTEGLNEMVPMITFPESVFNFTDIVDDGFNITNLWVGDGAEWDYNGLRVLAIGFTAGNGDWATDVKVSIDPIIIGLGDFNETLLDITITPETSTGLNEDEIEVVITNDLNQSIEFFRAKLTDHPNMNFMGFFVDGEPMSGPLTVPPEENRTFTYKIEWTPGTDGKFNITVGIRLDNGTVVDALIDPFWNSTWRQGKILTLNNTCGSNLSDVYMNRVLIDDIYIYDDAAAELRLRNARCNTLGGELINFTINETDNKYRAWIDFNVDSIRAYELSNISLVTFEEFEGTWPPTNWVNYSWGGVAEIEDQLELPGATGWLKDDASAFIGSYGSNVTVHYYEGNWSDPDPEYINDAFVYGPIDATDYNALTLKFESLGVGDSYGYQGANRSVYVSTVGDGSSYSNFAFVWGEPTIMPESSWNSRTVDLSDYAGYDNIYVAFVYKANYNSYWAIDDINITLGEQYGTEEWCLYYLNNTPVDDPVYTLDPGTPQSCLEAEIEPQYDSHESRIDSIQADDDCIFMQMWIEHAINGTDVYNGYQNWTGMIINQSSSPMKLDQYWANWTGQPYSEGTYTIWVEGYSCFDNSSVVIASFDYIVSQVMRLVTPYDDTVNYTSNEPVFNVQSSTPEVGCTLYIDGVANKTGFSLDVGFNDITGAGMFQDGEYNWTVNCTTGGAALQTFDLTIDEYDLVIYLEANQSTYKPTQTHSAAIGSNVSNNQGDTDYFYLYMYVRNESGSLVHIGEENWDILHEVTTEFNLEAMYQYYLLPQGNQNYTIFVELFDNMNVSMYEYNTTFEVYNTVPVVENCTMSPAPAYFDDTVTCICNYTDADGDPIVTTYVDWLIDNVLNVSNTNLSWSDAYNATDLVGCSITPWDGYSNGTTVAQDMYIYNYAPIHLTYQNMSINEDELLEYDFNCTDPEGHDVNHTIWETSWSAPIFP